MKKEVILNILLSIGMLALLVSAFLPLVLNSYSLYPWLRYIFVAAAFIIAGVRVLPRLGSRKEKKYSLRVRCLQAIEFWSSLCYLISALFLLSDPYHSTWLGFLTAGAVIQVYASFMIDRVLKKEAKGK